MSPKHPPTIDLDALQGRLDDLGHQPLADARPPQDNSHAVELALETAANANGHAASGNGHAGPDGEHAEAKLSPEAPATLPVPRLGAEAAANMTKLASAAAQDIRQLGQFAFDAGKRVQEECEQMALDVEANGGTVALHLTGLSQLLADVGMSNRETLHRLLGGAPPSIVPAAGNGHAPEPPAGTIKTMRAAPPTKFVRRPDDAAR
ncbi:MAG: hypothetical protein JO084_02730 [Bradyrhizobiaceae bacterium]|nr:hypothetical protein [Hyphomicrobiales bacterium]MBV9426626.1 hypothetical protein [Bradyrhizobiaceae bacterium]